VYFYQSKLECWNAKGINTWPNFSTCLGLAWFESAQRLNWTYLEWGMGPNIKSTLQKSFVVMGKHNMANGNIIEVLIETGGKEENICTWASLIWAWVELEQLIVALITTVTTLSLSALNNFIYSTEKRVEVHWLRAELAQAVNCNHMWVQYHGRDSVVVTIIFHTSESRASSCRPCASRNNSTILDICSPWLANYYEFSMSAVDKGFQNAALT